ncbi:MAG: FHA domain-containing protein [Limnochordales bacterium]|nr:FHA domain-containing protein [Limnochordales bacterium]
MPIWEWVWHFSWLAAAYVFLWQVVRATRSWTQIPATPVRSVASEPAVAPSRGSEEQTQQTARILVLQGNLSVRGADNPIEAGEELHLPLAENQVYIGRGPENDVQVHDAYVSSRHLRMYAEAGMVYVQDLGSRNGTFVNNKRLTAPVALDAGDEIRLGETRLRWLGCFNS